MEKNFHARKTETPNFMPTARLRKILPGCKFSMSFPSGLSGSSPWLPRFLAPRYGFGGTKLLVSGAGLSGGGLKKPLSWPWGAKEFVVGVL
jgi:hypothetical protein